jgi:hypothetical protein
MTRTRPTPSPLFCFSPASGHPNRCSPRPAGWLPALSVLPVAGVLSVLALLAPAARAEPEPLPTQEELHQLYNQQKYPEVLQKLARVMALKGIPAKAYDRHDLLRLRGETQLRIKANAAAEQAFNEAAKEAPDPAAAALDSATAVLIHHSPGGQDMPKPREKGKPPPAGISILDPEQRKLAMSALYRDEVTAAAPKIKAVKEAKSLPPIMDLMPTIGYLRTLESATTGGKSDQTKAMVSDLARHAQGLMADAIQDMARQTDFLDKYANQMIENDALIQDPVSGGLRREQRWRKRGLQPKDENQLKGIVNTCDKVVPASREMADALGTDAAGLDAVRTAAEKVGRKADQVLHADYRGEYLNPNGQ